MNLEFRLCFYFFVFIISLKLLLAQLGSALDLCMFCGSYDNFGV